MRQTTASTKTVNIWRMKRYQVRKRMVWRQFRNYTVNPLNWMSQWQRTGNVAHAQWRRLKIIRSDNTKHSRFLSLVGSFLLRREMAIAGYNKYNSLQFCSLLCLITTANGRLWLSLPYRKSDTTGCVFANIENVDVVQSVGLVGRSLCWC